MEESDIKESYVCQQPSKGLNGLNVNPVFKLAVEVSRDIRGSSH